MNNVSPEELSEGTVLMDRYGRFLRVIEHLRDHRDIYVAIRFDTRNRVAPSRYNGQTEISYKTLRKMGLRKPCPLCKLKRVTKQGTTCSGCYV